MPKQSAEWAGVFTSPVDNLCQESWPAHHWVGTDGWRGRILIDPADIERVQP